MMENFMASVSMELIGACDTALEANYTDYCTTNTTQGSYARTYDPMPHNHEATTSEDHVTHTNVRRRNRGNVWTEDEHRLFLLGLAKHGKGKWKSISVEFVKTRSSTQVASHAQKYFKRLTSSTNKAKRRPSIFDTTLVDSKDDRSQLDETKNPQTYCTDEQLEKVWADLPPLGELPDL